MSDRVMLAWFVALGIILGISTRVHVGAIFLAAVVVFVFVAASREHRDVKR